MGFIKIQAEVLCTRCLTACGPPEETRLQAAPGFCMAWSRFCPRHLVPLPGSSCFQSGMLLITASSPLADTAVVLPDEGQVAGQGELERWS